MEILAYIGSLLLAFCALPQAYKSIKDGHSNGISLAFLVMWTLGEILTLAYVIDILSIPLFLNYSINTIFCLIILKFKVRPRDER